MAATMKWKRRDDALVAPGVCHADVVAAVPCPPGDAGWIPVGRELPDMERTVMVFAARSIEPVWLGYYDVAGDGVTRVWRDVNGLALEGDEVPSHWRELPEPPLEDGELSKEVDCG